MGDEERLVVERVGELARLAFDLCALAALAVTLGAIILVQLAARLDARSQVTTDAHRLGRLGCGEHSLHRQENERHDDERHHRGRDGPVERMALGAAIQERQAEKAHRDRQAQPHDRQSLQLARKILE